MSKRVTQLDVHRASVRLMEARQALRDARWSGKAHRIGYAEAQAAIAEQALAETRKAAEWQLVTR